MRVRLWLLVLLLQVFPSLVQAAFYQWVDRQGVTHFTDNPDKIPARYRAKAKELELSDAPQTSPAPQPGAQAPAAEPAVTPPASFGGQPEPWWRSRFQALRSELKAQQETLADQQAKLVELKRKRVIYMRAQDRVAINSMQAEISASELRISELEGKLAELDRQATQAGVPSEWRQ